MRALVRLTGRGCYSLRRGLGGSPLPQGMTILLTTADRADERGFVPGAVVMCEGPGGPRPVEVIEETETALTELIRRVAGGPSLPSPSGAG